MPDTISSIFDQHGFIVSRETMEKLEAYDRLLLKWQDKINLIGPATIEERAMRHFFDSAQLLKFIPDTNIRMADLGSGAGFPGMVLAILGVADVHLIESDIRKATFLREVSRETNTPVTIHDKRAEDCQIENIDLFTARALAPLRELLGLFAGLQTKGHPSSCIVLKGAQWQDELEKAEKRWNFNHIEHDSLTGDGAKVIEINDLSKK